MSPSTELIAPHTDAKMTVIASQRTDVGKKPRSGELEGSEQPAPVVYLRTLFRESVGCEKFLRRPIESSFNKPSQETMDAYNLDAVKAVREHDATKLRAMIAEGKSLDACNRFGESLIHMACRHGDEEMVRLLIFEGNVRLDMTDDFGRTPLHDACWTSKPNFVVLDILLQVCPPDLLLAEDVRGHTPFHYARREHWDQWVDFLKTRRDTLLSTKSLHYAVVG